MKHQILAQIKALQKLAEALPDPATPSMRNVLPEAVYDRYAAYADDFASGCPARTLDEAFTWRESPEGQAYWEQIYDLLLRSPEALTAYHDASLTEAQKQELVFPKALQRALRFYGLKFAPQGAKPPYTDADGFPALPGYEPPANLKQMRNVLPERIFALFAANVVTRSSSDNPARILMQTFTWVNSPEGDTFWRKVYEHLKHPAMQAAYPQNFLSEEQKNAIFAAVAATN